MIPDASTSFVPARETDLWLTLAPLRRSGFNPTVRFLPDGIWRATRTPEGPATERLSQTDGTIFVDAWGPGADWLVKAAPVMCGAEDDDSGFTPSDRLVATLRHRLPGLRIARTRAVLEALVATIVEQKVAGMDAWRSYQSLVLALGERAPGPMRLRVPPAPERLASTPYFVYHRFGIERRRAEAIRYAAQRAARIEEAADMPAAEAAKRLQALPGVGVWSAGEVGLVALGDPDAVSVGDYHLPHIVSYAFTGEPRGTDERMLQLLEPYRGHRGRVQRYLEASGIGPPRRGPRMPLRNLAEL